MAVWILIGALVAVAALAAYAHSSLEALHRCVESAWARLDRLLHRRSDLIPKLIAATGTRPVGRPDLMQELTAARQAVLDARGIPARYEGENRLTAALRDFFIFVDADAGLHGGGALLSLEEALTAAENEIAAARHTYNDRVMALNTRRYRLPWRLMASRFSPAEYFIIDEPAHR